jgi:hypothetical protein
MMLWSLAELGWVVRIRMWLRQSLVCAIVGAEIMIFEPHGISQLAYLVFSLICTPLY